MPYDIWRLKEDEMTVIQGDWVNPYQEASKLTEETGVSHVAVEQGSQYEQLLLAVKEREEDTSPVNADPDAILRMIESLEEQYQQGNISFEECSRQQQRWYRLLARVDGNH